MKNHNFNWNATAYFEELSAKNKLAQAGKYHASRELCQIHLNTAEAKLVLGEAKHRGATVATSDTKRSEVAAVGSLANTMPLL